MIVDRIEIMAVYPIPLYEIRRELVAVNSRFIATLAPVFSIEEARAFVARIKKEFSNASHNVPAYIIGGGNTVTEYFSDDGEPSGTAGKPALAVLRGSGLGDVAVVVTRYFGGTKLGAGGLVRAYGDAVRAVLEDLPRAVKVTTHTVLVAAPYPLYERLRLLIAAHHGQVLDEDFAADVTLIARFVAERLAPFQAALGQMSNGTLQAQVVETDPAAIMPLDGLFQE